MAVRRPRAEPDEWDVYALASAPQPPRVQAGRLSLRVFIVGPVAVIAGPPPRAGTSSEEALRQQHAIVLALADRVDPLLPARFGSRMTMARLERILRPSLDVVAEALEHVRGRQQMTVRFIGPQPFAPASSTSRASGTAYLTQRRAACRALPTEVAPLEAAVRSLVVDQRVRPGRGRMHATLFHLIPRSQVDAYRAAFEAALPRIEPWHAALSGPWPPFAFAPEVIG
jgi:hypothetical protein